MPVIDTESTIQTNTDAPCRLPIPIPQRALSVSESVVSALQCRSAVTVIPPLSDTHTHTLAFKIENESDAAESLNCGNSARKWRSTSKLLPCHARHCCSLVLMITVLVKDE